MMMMMMNCCLFRTEKYLRSPNSQYKKINVRNFN